MAVANVSLRRDTACYFLCDPHNLSLAHCGGSNSSRFIPLLTQFAQELSSSKQ